MSEHYRRCPDDFRTVLTVPEDAQMISEGLPNVAVQSSLACYLGLKRDI